MYWYSTRLQLHAHGNLSLFGESIDIAVIRRNLCPNMENKNLRKKVKIEESDALLFGAVCNKWEVKYWWWQRNEIYLCCAISCVGKGLVVIGTLHRTT